MNVKRDKILQIYDKFKFLFQNSYRNVIYFKGIDTQLLYNINDWKLFFKIINLIIEKENIDHNKKDGLLNLIFNKKIINKRPEEIFSKIAIWINQKQNTVYYYSYEQYTSNMENLLNLISEFVDNYDIEISIIKKENLKLFFKEEISIEIEKEFEKIEKWINEKEYETAANKIEHLYTNYFLKLFFKEQKIDKKEVIDLISNKNQLLEQMKTTEEFNNIFSLISKIRNAIKGRAKKSNDETTNLISNIFWNNDLTNEKERKSFLKLYVDFSKTLFNFLINNSDLK